MDDGKKNSLVTPAQSWPFMFHAGVVLLVAWITSLAHLNVALVCALGFLYLYQIEGRLRTRLNWKIRHEEEKKASKARIAEGETMRWMEQVLQKTWPIIFEDISSILMVPLNSMLDQFKPWSAKQVIVKKLSLGSIAPRITMIRILDTPIDGDDLAIETTMEWMAAEDMSAEVAVKPLRRLGWGIWVPFHICNLRFKGKAKVGVKLKAGWPVIERIRICFGTAPYVDMSARPLYSSGVDVTELPGISKFTDTLLADILTRSLVEPSMIEIDMERLMRDVMRFPGPAGGDWCTVHDHSPKMSVVLEVLEAKDLRVADKNGFSDPYVKVEFGNQKRVTEVMWKTVDPTWNETFNFLVPSGQLPNTVVLRVRDKDPFRDDKLGFCHVEISQYEGGKRNDFWLPLQNVKSGRIHLAITITDNLTSSQGSTDVSNSTTVKSADLRLTPECHDCEIPPSPGNGPSQSSLASPHAKPESSRSGISRTLTPSMKIETLPPSSDIEKTSISGEEYSPGTSSQLKSPSSSTAEEEKAAVIVMGFGESGAVKVRQFKDVEPCQRSNVTGTEHGENAPFLPEKGQRRRRRSKQAPHSKSDRGRKGFKNDAKTPLGSDNRKEQQLCNKRCNWCWCYGS